MDNDDKIEKDIRHQTHKATSLFIKDDIKYNNAPNLYDLDLEFSNTKKNKNIVIPVTLILFTVISIGASYWVTQYIAYQNSQIPISINAFEDVNLREIFDKAKQNEKELENAKRALSDAEKESKDKISQLINSAEREISIIEEENSINKNSEIAKINSELQSELAMEEALFESERITLENKILEIQNNIDSYDTRTLEKAKEQEDLINNQQKIFDMEMSETVKYYEDKISNIEINKTNEIDDITANHNSLVSTIKYNNRLAIMALESKYNPVNDGNDTFIGDEIEKPYATIENTKIDGSYLYDETISKEYVTKQIGFIEKSEEIINTLKEIPYYNYPREAIEYLEYNNHLTINNYKTLIGKVSETKEELLRKESELDQLDFFLYTYVKKNRLNGVIVDPRTDDIKIFIDPIYSIKDDTVGLIYRNDSDFIGTVKFKNIDNKIVAHTLKLVDSNRPMEPFDMILIDLE